MTSIAFYFTTLEEYFTESLDLPCIHGVSEGTYLAVGLIITTAFIGQDFWKTSISFKTHTLKYNQIALYSFFTFSMLFCIFRYNFIYYLQISIMKVIKLSKKKAAINFITTIIFGYLLFSIFICVFYSNSKLIKDYPKVIIYLYGFVFAKLVVNKLVLLL